MRARGARQNTHLWSCYLASALAFCALAEPSVAVADEDPTMGVSSNKYSAQAPGSVGVSAGDAGRLHPYVHLDLHWVTNPGRLNTVNTSDFMTAGHIGLELARPGSSTDISLNADLEYDKYWGVQNPQSANLTSIAAHGDLAALFNKDGYLTLRLYDHFTRSADPANQTITYRLEHIYDELDLALDIRPGDGALTLTLADGAFYDYYDRSNYGINPGALDNFRHLPSIRAAWKFLPKTSIFIEGTGQFTYYTVPQPASTNGDINSTIFNADAGITGSFTTRITSLVKVGYGTTLVATGGLQTFIGQIEFAYALDEASSLRLGVIRTMQPTSYFGYYTLDNGYFRWDQRITTQTTLSFDAGYNIIDYGPVVNGPAFGRHDTDITGGLSLRQRFNDWFGLALIDHLDYRQSNFVTLLGNAGYFFNDVFLQIDLRY